MIRDRGTKIRRSSRRPRPSVPGPVVQPALVPLTVVLVVAPQLLGGVFPWSVAIIALLAAVAAAQAGRRIEIINPTRREAKLLDWMMLAALVWTGLQLLPLPSALVSLFVPESVEAWRANAPLYGKAARAWVPLSLDPGATRLELAKGSAIMAVFFASRVFAASHRRRLVLMAVGASATLLACVAFAHKIAGATHVFGVYEPVYASSRLLAPIMNENHLGGFMAMACPILLGLTLDAKGPERRVAWALCAGACAIAGLLSFSRAGIIALVLGVAVFLGAYVVRLHRSDASVTRSRAVPMIAAAAFGTMLIAGIFGGSNLARELSYTHNLTSKLEAAQAALPVIASHPITGVGRGGFSAAFVGEHGAQKRFYQPENLLVQWTSEWGLVISLVLLAVIVWSIGRAFRLRRSGAHLGALAGLVAMGIHELADFSLEVTGIAVVAAATLGAVADSVAVRPRVPLRKLCLVTSVLALGAAALALSLHGRDVFTLEQRLKQGLAANDHAQVRALVESGLTLHPSEPILALTGAEVAVRENDGSAGRWINRAQELAPLWSAPHLLAARWLFSKGRMDQALIEIREAEARRPGSGRETICQLLKERSDPQIALRAAPPGEGAAPFLDRAAQCLPLSSPVAIAIDESARDLDPTIAGPTVRQARRLLVANNPRDAIDLLLEANKRDVLAQRILAEAYMRVGDTESAERTIAVFVNQRKVSSDVLRTAVSIYLALGDGAQVRALAAKLRSQTRGKLQELASVERFLGEQYESHERYGLALRAYEDSNRLAEARGTQLSIARVALAMGNRERAILVYRQLCRTDGGQGKACRRAEDLTKPEELGP